MFGKQLKSKSRTVWCSTQSVTWFWEWDQGRLISPAGAGGRVGGAGGAGGGGGGGQQSRFTANQIIFASHLLLLGLRPSTWGWNWSKQEVRQQLRLVSSHQLSKDSGAWFIEGTVCRNCQREIQKPSLLNCFQPWKVWHFYGTHELCVILYWYLDLYSNLKCWTTVSETNLGSCISEACFQ